MVADTFKDGYTGRAVIEDHAAEVEFSSTRQILIGDTGDRMLGDINWSGQAVLQNPPSPGLLEFVGPVTVVVGERVGSAIVVDATPGTGFIYLNGIGTPPFGACPVP